MKMALGILLGTKNDFQLETGFNKRIYSYKIQSKNIELI